MRITNEASGGQRVRWDQWLLYPLIALFLTAGAAALAGASTGKPGTIYRVIQLSANPSAFSPDINASGQVAFTETVDGISRAKFYDGNSVRDLGTLGGPGATAIALNDRGQVTGDATVNPDGSIAHAYRWSEATGMLDISRPGQGNSRGADINNKGQVSGNAVFDPASGPNPRAFFWSPHTGMLDIGTLGDSYSFATAMNDAGTVVGYSPENTDSPFSILAFRWTRAAGIGGIGTLPDEFTLASDINNAGYIVGASQFPPGGPVHAFLWTPREGLIDLGTGTGNRSTAVRVNDKGVVVGDVLNFPILFHGFVWSRETGLIEIGAELPRIQTSANDVNNRGQVVGGFDGRAYVWTRAQGVVDLNTRIAGAPDDLVLTSGLAISDNGSIVAGANTGLVLLVPTAGSAKAPVVGPVKLSGTPRINMPLSFSATFKDNDVRDAHKASWAWGDGSKDAGTVSERNGTGSVSGQHTFRSPGIYTVRLTVTDSSGKSTTVHRKVIVCGSGAYVAGDGQFISPPGASRLAPNQSGVATFSFLSPTTGVRSAQGNARVEFSAAGLHFLSKQIDSFVARGGQVQYLGSGTVNGTGGYRFMLMASDGKRDGGKDRFRIRIWHHEPGSKAEIVDYDNLLDQRARGTSEGSALEDGAIEVHSG